MAEKVTADIGFEKSEETDCVSFCKKSCVESDWTPHKTRA